MTAGASTPWPDMMRLGVAMGLRPADVWRLSLREWRWLTARPSGGALRREDLERMAERWPDDG